MKLKAKNYYALLCDCSAKGKKDMLICGVYASRKEAKEVADEIKKCPAKHYIKKANIQIEYEN